MKRPPTFSDGIRGRGVIPPPFLGAGSLTRFPGASSIFYISPFSPGGRATAPRPRSPNFGRFSGRFGNCHASPSGGRSWDLYRGGPHTRAERSAFSLASLFFRFFFPLFSGIFRAILFIFREPLLVFFCQIFFMGGSPLSS